VGVFNLAGTNLATVDMANYVTSRSSVNGRETFVLFEKDDVFTLHFLTA
jgi:hypothetical protein